MSRTGSMTVEVAPRRSRKGKTTPEPLAIGEINQTVFTCPQCTRPLMLGARRCPGCGTRLIIGVQASRAGIFLAVGTFGGLILAGVLWMTATMFGTGAPGTQAGGVAGPGASSSTAVSSSASPGPGATVGTGTSSVPALSRSALVQAVAVDQRLAASKLTLASALKAKNLDAYGVAQTLRVMSADAVVGLQLSAHVGAWTDGKVLSGEMTTFYTAIQETAANGLSASMRNDNAYRAAGQRMIAVLAGLGALDIRIRDVASQAGVTFSAPESAAP